MYAVKIRILRVELEQAVRNRIDIISTEDDGENRRNPNEKS